MEEIQREEVYKGRAFDVCQVQVRMPDRQEKKYDLVIHRGAVVIVPYAQDHLLFVRQYRLGAAEDLLELPAGVIESGEPPEECARREIREETGMAASHWQKLGELYIAPGYCTEYQHIFLATQLTPAPLQPDSDEFIEVIKIPVLEAYQMAANGILRDGKTLAALLLARPYLIIGENTV